jgi:predicted O-methyltransferase YrrM
MLTLVGISYFCFMDIRHNQYYHRFKEILSDPTNKLIKRVKEAGAIENGIVTMYNDLKVYKNCYYDEFSDIFWLNGGIHEPQEEYLFHSTLSKIRKKSPVMLELGSYWGFYSMSLLKKKPEAECFCIEAGEREMKSGKSNFELNGMKADFTLGAVGDKGIRVDDFLNQKGIAHLDILHSDIQGYEAQMLSGAREYFLAKAIDYVFISTHSQELHSTCLDFLKQMEYNVVASVDLDETFSCDGLIVAQNPRLAFKPIEFPKKSETLLISDEEVEALIQKMRI